MKRYKVTARIECEVEADNRNILIGTIANALEDVILHAGIKYNGFGIENLEEIKEELKCCPFCGGAATVGEVIPGWYKVCCKNDNCIGCNTGKNYQLREEAIEAWNRRAGTCKTKT